MNHEQTIRLEDFIFQFLDVGTDIFLVGAGLWRWRRASIAGRFLAVDFLLGLLWNTIAFGRGNSVIPNLVITHVYVLIDFVLTFLFFNFCNPVFRRKNIGIYVCISGALFWLIDSFVTLRGHNYFTFFEPFTSLCEVVVAIFALAIMINRNEYGKRTNPEFWFTLLLLFNAGTTYFFYITNDMLLKYPDAYFVGKVFECVVAYIFNIGMGVVFLRYPKKNISVG